MPIAPSLSYYFPHRWKMKHDGHPPSSSKWIQWTRLECELSSSITQSHKPLHHRKVLKAFIFIHISCQMIRIDDRFPRHEENTEQMNITKSLDTLLTFSPEINQREKQEWKERNSWTQAKYNPFRQLHITPFVLWSFTVLRTD